MSPRRHLHRPSPRCPSSFNTPPSRRWRAISPLLRSSLHRALPPARHGLYRRQYRRARCRASPRGERGSAPCATWRDARGCPRRPRLRWWWSMTTMTRMLVTDSSPSLTTWRSASPPSWSPAIPRAPRPGALGGHGAQGGGHGAQGGDGTVGGRGHCCQGTGLPGSFEVSFGHSLLFSRLQLERLPSPEELEGPLEPLLDDVQPE
ncbi:unnamed protein product [Closterium sp. NIES-53]